MTMPGFTAEVGLGESTTHYAGTTSHGGAGGGGQLSAALVAPTVCKTSSCLTVGRCKTRVRCCRLPGRVHLHGGSLLHRPAVLTSRALDATACPTHRKPALSGWSAPT